jgi:hypothetical protein
MLGAGTVTALTVGTRFAGTAAAALGASFFAVLAFGPSISFLTQGTPVHANWAIMAWTGPLAGFAMGALALFATAIAVRSPHGQNEWGFVARRCMAAGLAGLGFCAFWAGASLGLALALYGRPTIHSASDGLVLPMVAILIGLSGVVAVNAIRMRSGGVWTALGHILWGFFGVVALTIGIPMAMDMVAIDDSKTLVQRYNLLVVFYPVLWLGYAAITSGIVICGLRWLRFSLSAHQRNEVNPPSTGSTWPVTYDDSAEIKNKAA